MWTNNLGATRIMVINDEVANNDLQKSVLRMAAPSNVSTSIISRDTAVKIFHQGNIVDKEYL